MISGCEELLSCDAIDDIQKFLLENADENGDHADDATWVLTSSFVILTMQSGFGLLEMGSTSIGNEVNIMIKNVVDVVFGAWAFYFFGYGIAFGTPSNPFMGLGDFAPDPGDDPVASGQFFSKYIFQFSFAATSTTIVSGCIAMRARFSVYCVFSFVAVIFYAFVAHWIWAENGWLKQLGVHDFAGAGPVHLFGGMNGLIGIVMIGPRTGRFDGTRPPSDFAPSSTTSMLFGLFMLWWGWIGFNCGSTFGITGERWIVATRVALTTINSTAGGGLLSIIYSLSVTEGKLVRPSYIIDGILGALVSITANCAVVRSYDALIIGVVGATVSLSVNWFVENYLKLDDPVGAIGVHVGGSLWGLIAVGLFSDESLPGVMVPDGLFRGGGWRLLGVQCLAIVAIVFWSLVCVSLYFYGIGVAIGKKLHDPRAGLRVSKDEETIGADAFLHGIDTRGPEVTFSLHGLDMRQQQVDASRNGTQEKSSSSLAHGSVAESDGGINSTTHSRTRRRLERAHSSRMGLF